jgi:lipopolysaccharide transport system permease protein
MNNQKVTIYEAGYRHKTGVIKSWSIMLSNIFAAKDLIIQLFRRDFLMTYQKTFLGLGWLLISPLIGIASWIFMNSAGVLNAGDVVIPYPAYVLIGTSIWGLFLGFYSAAAQTLGAGSGFITQVRYSHEVLLVKQTAQHLAGFLVTFALNIVVLLSFHIVPSWKIIFFPVLILPLFLLGAGIGLIIALMNVIVPDLQKGFDSFIGLLFYATPIVFSLENIAPALKKVILYNPLTYLVVTVRDCIIYGRVDYPYEFSLSALFSLGIFLFAWRIFYLSEDKIIEKMI